MHEVTTPLRNATLEVSADRLDDLRLMLREQLVDDHQLLQDAEDVDDREGATAIRARIDFVWSLAKQAGGIY